MKFTQVYRAVVVTAAASLAMTACTPAGGGSGAQGQGGDTANDTLRISISAPPSNFQVGNWSGAESYLYTGVYDTILSLDPNGKISPEIAESWQYSEDRTKLTLKIREGMKFSNGTPVDAAAVAASLEASRKGASTSQNLAALSSVEASDNKTVLVTLSAPDAALLPSLTGSIGVVGAVEVLTADSSKLEPVGSGPYILDKKATTVGSSYVLERNSDHWNVDAYPYERVEVKVLADATAVQNALLAGQIDVIGTGISPAVLKQFPTSKFASGENKPVALASLWLVDREGKVVPALADERVRRAINLAFNRDSIAKNLTGEGSGPTNQVVSPTGEAFSEDLRGETPYDLAKAKSLMAEAGYADGFTVTMPSTVVSTQFEPTITQSLGDIGIKVTWESVPFQDFYPKVLGGNYGMFFMYNGFTGFDAQDVDASLAGIFNPYASTTPELSKLLLAADSASDEGQGAAYEAVNEYLVKQSWYAPLTYSSGFWVASKKVTYTPPTTYGVNLRPFAPASSN
jgi:peptide/nickel transport system substrate-binding protein